MTLHQRLKIAVLTIASVGLYGNNGSFAADEYKQALAKYA